ncbi:MAG TPA: hypothetical protein PLH93_07640, partial [Flavobacteriales bacterium]|nr:hypothetical protein [Flavobacteriales bacterium]
MTRHTASLLLAFTLMFGAGSVRAQQALVRWAYGPLARPGDAAFVVEGGAIHTASGPFGTRGPCVYLIEGDKARFQKLKTGL